MLKRGAPKVGFDPRTPDHGRTVKHQCGTRYTTLPVLKFTNARSEFVSPRLEAHARKRIARRTPGDELLELGHFGAQGI